MTVVTTVTTGAALSPRERLRALIAEREALYRERLANGYLYTHQTARLHEIERETAACWDEIRRREAGRPRALVAT